MKVSHAVTILLMELHIEKGRLLEAVKHEFRGLCVFVEHIGKKVYRHVLRHKIPVYAKNTENEKKSVLNEHSAEVPEWETIVFYKAKKREKSMKELGTEIGEKLQAGKKIHIVDNGLSIKETWDFASAMKEKYPIANDNFWLTISPIEWEHLQGDEAIERVREIQRTKKLPDYMTISW
jgi:RNase P protein component